MIYPTKNGVPDVKSRSFGQILSEVCAFWKSRTVRVATPKEGRNTPPLSRTPSDKKLGVIARLRNRIVSLFKAPVVSKHVTVQLGNEFLEGIKGEYKKKAEEINGSGNKEYHETFLTDVDRCTWIVQGQKIEGKDSNEKITAMQNIFNEMKIDESTQWLIGRLGNQEALADVEIETQKIGRLVKDGKTSGKTTYELNININRDEIQLTISHEAALAMMDFVKFKAYPENLDQNTENPNDVKGSVKYSFSINMKRDKKNSSISDIQYSNTDVKVFIKAEKLMKSHN